MAQGDPNEPVLFCFALGECSILLSLYLAIFEIRALTPRGLIFWPKNSSNNLLLTYPLTWTTFWWHEINFIFLPNWWRKIWNLHYHICSDSRRFSNTARRLYWSRSLSLSLCCAASFLFSSCTATKTEGSSICVTFAFLHLTINLNIWNCDWNIDFFLLISSILKNYAIYVL